MQTDLHLQRCNLEIRVENSNDVVSALGLKVCFCPLPETACPSHHHTHVLLSPLITQAFVIWLYDTECLAKAEIVCRTTFPGSLLKLPPPAFQAVEFWVWVITSIIEIVLFQVSWQWSGKSTKVSVDYSWLTFSSSVSSGALSGSPPAVRTVRTAANHPDKWLHTDPGAARHSKAACTDCANVFITKDDQTRRIYITSLICQMEKLPFFHSDENVKIFVFACGCFRHYGH